MSCYVAIHVIYIQFRLKGHSQDIQHHICFYYYYFNYSELLSKAVILHLNVVLVFNAQ